MSIHAKTELENLMKIMNEYKLTEKVYNMAKYKKYVYIDQLNIPMDDILHVERVLRTYCFL